MNFTDVEYSNRINPIQRKYIPDLAAASETAATLLASLNKGGGEKKGGSEAFFTNSAENFLAAIIYFFVNFHPVGFKDGKKLKRFISLEGKEHMGRKYEVVIRNWDDFNALTARAAWCWTSWTRKATTSRPMKTACSWSWRAFPTRTEPARR